MELSFQSKFGNRISHMFTFKTNKDTSVWYNVQCDCGDDEQDIVMEVEYDREVNMLFLHFYKTIFYNNWFYIDSDATMVEKIKHKINALASRIKDSMKLLFTGYLKMSDEFILREEKHINDFIEAMEEGKQFCIKGNGDIDEWLNKQKEV